MTTVNAMKARTIRAELARRNAADIQATEALISARTTVTEDGEIVAVEPSGAYAIGSGPGATKPLAHILDELERTSPDLFGKPAAETATTRSAVVVDPSKPGFNLTAALVAARSDPHLYSELMDRLAPKPLRVF